MRAYRATDSRRLGTWGILQAETELGLRDGATFVFGGDSQDKGPGDIRIAKQLAALKRRYPDRVQLIIGNRDANKMRLTTELGEEALASDAVRTDGMFPYWDKPGTAKTPQSFLDEVGSNARMPNTTMNRVGPRRTLSFYRAAWPATCPKCISSPPFAGIRCNCHCGGSLPFSARGRVGQIGESDNNTAANRLKWMLKYTMGSDGAFERRQIELAALRGCLPEEVSDGDVVESYRSECDPNSSDPWMLEYLRLGVLAYRQGPHLFVHGGINATNMGTVPGSSEVIPDVDTWILELNAWKDAQVAAFEADPYVPI